MVLKNKATVVGVEVVCCRNDTNITQCGVKEQSNCRNDTDTKQCGVKEQRNCREGGDSVL